MIGRITRAAIIVAAAFHGPLHAASDDLQTGWAAWFNSAKLSDRWSLVSDVQLRSSDGWEDLRNFIGRGGLSYALDDRHSLAAGYAYIGTYAPGAPDLTEHRSWQQLIAQRRVGGSPLTHRLRLEQRFIERATGDDLYSDRLRYFARLLLPFAGPGTTPFTAAECLLCRENARLAVVILQLAVAVESDRGCGHIVMLPVS